MFKGSSEDHLTEGEEPDGPTLHEIVVKSHNCIISCQGDCLSLFSGFLTITKSEETSNSVRLIFGSLYNICATFILCTCDLFTCLYALLHNQAQSSFIPFLVGVIRNFTAHNQMYQEKEWNMYDTL